jgi:hypothetical protein
MKIVSQTDAYKRIAQKRDGLDIIPLDTKVLPYQDEEGYAIELRGFYTIGDLEWIIKDLKNLNNNRDTGA